MSSTTSPNDRPALQYVSQPIRRGNGKPKEQLLLPIYFPQQNRTVNFVLDTISRDTVVSPAAAEVLGVASEESLANGHVKRVGDFRVMWGPKVTLPAARLGNADAHFFAVLDAVVVNLERMGFSETVGGVLGLDALSSFDLDFDFPRSVVRVYMAGAVERGLLDTAGLEGVACGVLPGGKLGIKMELNGGGFFTGVLDVGSNSSAGNWAAARDLDVTTLVAGEASSYPRETGRSRPLFKAHFDTVQLGHVLLASVPEEKGGSRSRSDSGSGGSSSSGGSSGSRGSSSASSSSRDSGGGSTRRKGSGKGSTSSSGSSSDCRRGGLGSGNGGSGSSVSSGSSESDTSSGSDSGGGSGGGGSDALEGRLHVYIGHLPEFDTLSADVAGKNDQSRQLAMVGLDLLGDSRLVLSCKSKKLFFKPKEINDVWAGQVI